MVVVNMRLFGDALAASLGHCGDIVVVARGSLGGAEAIRLFEEAQPDVVLLDYFLRGRGGPETAEAIRGASPTTKVLLLSSVHGPQQVERALVAGAVGFLPVSLSVRHVAEAIREAHEDRSLVFADDLAGLVDELNARVRRGDEIRRRCATLTGREIEVLRRLCEGETTTQVAIALSVTSGTVKNQLTRIYDKLGVRTRMEAIDVARRTGVVTSHGRLGG